MSNKFTVLCDNIQDQEALLRLSRDLGWRYHREESIERTLEHSGKYPLKHFHYRDPKGERVIRGTKRSDGTADYRFPRDTAAILAALKAPVPAPEPKEEPVVIGGSRVRFEEDGVRVGCTRVTKGQIRTVAERFFEVQDKAGAPATTGGETNGKAKAVAV